MNPAYTLRQATNRDFAFMRDTKLNGLQPYVEALWGWNRQQQEELFSARFDPDQSQIVSVGGVDAGFIVIENTDPIFLAGIYLTAEARRHGIGSALLRDLMAKALRHGKTMTLRVLKGNPARRLYERLGWSRVGETDAHILMQWPSPSGSSPE
jgi:GNAT superfamily N-acetyltransferase